MSRLSRFIYALAAQRGADYVCLVSAEGKASRLTWTDSSNLDGISPMGVQVVQVVQAFFQIAQKTEYKFISEPLFRPANVDIVDGPACEVRK